MVFECTGTGFGIWHGIRYSYVGGDPVNRNDPSGLDVYTDWRFLVPGGLGPALTSSIDVVASPLLTAYFGIDMIPLFNYFSAYAGWWLGAFKDDLAGSQEGNAGTPLPAANTFVSPAVRALAIQSLTRPACGGLFGNGADPGTVLQQALAGASTAISAIRFVDLGPAGPVALTTTDPAVWHADIQQWVVNSAHIDISTSGSWFTGWVNDRSRYGNYTDDQFMAETLIHELGEVFRVVSFMGGFLIPPHPYDNSSSWDREILNACFGSPTP